MALPLDDIAPLRTILAQRPFGLATDIDGTISPIVDRPDEATVTEASRRHLWEIARRAEVEIEGAPMRLLFPMLVFLFPPILVLVLYPPAARLIEQLTGAGPGGLGF